MFRIIDRWELPEVTFYELESNVTSIQGPLFSYGKPGEKDSRGRPKYGELYDSLDYAMVAWVGEKYTGPRSAGGTGVGTAADWFMRSIGAE